MKRIVASVALAAAAILPVLPATFAHAAPSGTAVSHVFQLPCDDPVCDPDNDSDIAESALIKKDVQIQVVSTSSIGLTWVRLEAQYDNGDWVCLKHWTADGATSFNEWYDWNTTRFPGSAGDPPGSCPESSSHGDDTSNGTYDLHVVAKERVTDATQTSSQFSVDVNNRPAEPSWAGDPTVEGDAPEKNPLVTLRWTANDEPDILEYHYLRSDPSGAEWEFPVSAARPGGQGCERDGDTYTCVDDYFAGSQWGGTYTYSLIAYRSSPSTGDHCAIGSQPGCVQSPISGEVSATLHEPPPPPSLSPTPPPISTSPTTGATKAASGSGSHRRSGGSRSTYTRPDYSEFYKGTYKSTLPYDERDSGPELVLPGEAGQPDQRLLAAGDETPIVDLERSNRVLESIAGGLILLLLAMHMGRLLRDR